MNPVEEKQQQKQQQQQQNNNTKNQNVPNLENQHTRHSKCV